MQRGRGFSSAASVSWPGLKENLMVSVEARETPMIKQVADVLQVGVLPVNSLDRSGQVR